MQSQDPYPPESERGTMKMGASAEVCRYHLAEQQRQLDQARRPLNAMSLARVKTAIKEGYKAAPCGTWIETWYFDALLEVILIQRDLTEGTNLGG